MRYYGIDLHSDSMTAAVLEPSDGVWKSWTFSCSLHGPAFQSFLRELKSQDPILVEATTLSFCFHRQVASRVRACHILNTHRLERRGNRTDKIDAIRLVKILGYNELMGPDLRSRPHIYVPPKEVQELRALFSTYSLTKS